MCYFWAFFFFNESSLISIIPYTILTNKEWAYCTWAGWHELELISGLLNFLLNNYWWMRLSILWRIIEIEKGVIRRVCRPRWITPSEISTILHVMRKLYYSFKIIRSLKTWLEHAYLHRSFDVKFIFDSAPLAIISPSSYSWNKWNVRHFCFHKQFNSTSSPGLLG